MIGFSRPAWEIGLSGIICGRRILSVEISSGQQSELDVVKVLREFSNADFLNIKGKDEDALNFQRELIFIISQLGRSGKIVIETDGNIMPDYQLRQLVAQWVINIDNSSGSISFIPAFAEMGSAVFVFRNDDDNFSNVEEIINSFAINPVRVWLAPSVATVQIASAVLEEGWNLCIPSFCEDR